MAEPCGVISIKLRASVLEPLKQRRDALGITVSDQIRMALELWLEQSTGALERLVPPRDPANDPTLEILRTASSQLIEVAKTIAEGAKTIARIEKVRKRPLRRKPRKDSKPYAKPMAAAAAVGLEP